MRIIKIIRLCSFICILLLIISIHGSVSAYRTQVGYFIDDKVVSFVGSKQGVVGSDVENVGDVNGDGVDDFAITSGEEEVDAPDSARVYLMFGGENEWTHEYSLVNADVTIYVESDSYAVNEIVGNADFNNDGLKDFMFSSSAWGPDFTQLGKIYLVLGRPTEDWSSTMHGSDFFQIIGDNDLDSLGYSLAFGDINNDNFDDLIYSSPFSNTDSLYSTGRVYITFGSNSELPTEVVTASQIANASFYGALEGDRVGTKVAYLGDINNDSFGDLLISSEYRDHSGTDTGIVYIVFGRESLHFSSSVIVSSVSEVTIYGESDQDQLGSNAIGAGDVNGDGFDDFLISAVTNSEYTYLAGQVYLFYGREKNAFNQLISVSSADVSFVGEEDYDRLGETLGSLGDLNGDGYDDFVIISQANSHAGSRAGKAYLFYGHNSLTEFSPDMNVRKAKVVIYGEGGNSIWFSNAVSSGDFNDDGSTDILFGVTGSDVSTIATGEVFLVEHILNPEQMQQTTTIVNTNEEEGFIGSLSFPILSTLNVLVFMIVIYIRKYYEE